MRHRDDRRSTARGVFESSPLAVVATAVCFHAGAAPTTECHRASLAGTTVVTRQDHDPGDCAGPFALPHDPLVRGLTLDAVRDGTV